jgi:WD40 repeat protein
MAVDPCRVQDRTRTTADDTINLDPPNSQAEGMPAAETIIRYVGDYELRAELGRGGMGVVYRARQVSLNRPVAVKLIRSGELAGEDELRRFQNEAKAVAQLDHPGIVPVYEVGEHYGRRYFSMKLVSGGSLADRLTAYRDNPRAAAAILVEAAEAVHHAHVRGILHRDLKPANILVDDEGHPQITDFGLAKRVEAEDEAELTTSGALLGTPAYMAPEQALGRRSAITTATDVHGLGAVLYALLTGRAPFLGDSLMDTLTQVKEQPPVPPRKLNPKAPSDLEVMCLKCLEKDPRRRYTSAQALADDLQAWLEGRPITARRVSSLERAALFVRRRPALVSVYGLTAAVLVLVGFGGSLAWLWRAAERARAQAVVARDREAKARTEAQKARDAEARARAEAERQREKVEHLEYGRTLQVALQEWRESNVGATLDLLKGTRSDLRGWEWHYVNRLCHADVLTLRSDRPTTDDTAAYDSASFSPDGSQIVTAGKGGTVRIWDARTGAKIQTLRGFISPIPLAASPGLLAAFSADGSRVVSVSPSREATVWDASTGAELLTLTGHGGDVASVAFSPDGSRIVTASWDHTAKVWDATSGVEILALRGHSSALFTASYSADGSRIVTASADRSAKVWEAATGAQLLNLNARTSPLRSALFSPDGSRIVTVNQDNTARVWDATTGTEILTLPGHESTVSSASFSPDGSRIVTASNENTAKVWDAVTGAAIFTLKGHRLSVHSASFSPDGSRIVTASGDGTAKVWDASGRRNVEGLTLKKRSSGSPAAASFSPDGTRIVSNDGGQLKVWDAANGAEVLTFRPNAEAVASQSFSPDGTRIVTGGSRGTAQVWETATGAAVLTINAHNSYIYSATFSRDGSRIVTAGYDNTAKVWDAATGAAILTLAGQRRTVYSASFSFDGSRIVTAGEDPWAMVWDATTGAGVLALKRGRLPISLRSASFSPDGLRIVTADGGGVPVVWDARNGAELFTLKGHTGAVHGASFSPDGSRIVTASNDRTAKIWDATTGTELLTLRGHSNTVNSASFSPDGARIVTGSQDGTVKVWDAGPSAPGPL